MKRVWEWEGDAMTVGFTRLVKDRRYVYDGWNMIVELDAMTATGTGLAGASVVRTQVWGEDLSGTLEGAGGVGGLLAVRHGGQTYVPMLDGNGNVMGLQGLGGALDGQTVARYDYDAFGHRITNTAPALGEDVNPFGFSTKFTDEETGLAYYGYRYYAAEMGRWLNRDPIGERGGLNLYGMVGNDPVNGVDYLGRFDVNHFARLMRQRGFEQDSEFNSPGERFWNTFFAPWEGDTFKAGLEFKGYVSCSDEGFLESSGITLRKTYSTSDISVTMSGHKSFMINLGHKARSARVVAKAVASRSANFRRDFMEGAVGEAGEHLVAEAIVAGVTGKLATGREALVAGLGSFLAAGLINAVTSSDETATYIWDIKLECECKKTGQDTSSPGKYKVKHSVGEAHGGHDGSSLYWRADDWSGGH